MNDRVEELKKLGREKLEAMARSMGIRPDKTIVGTARAIEKREFSDRRSANQRPHIKDIF